MSRLAALSFAILLSTAAGAAADPPSDAARRAREMWRGGEQRGEEGRSREGRGRAEGDRGGDDHGENNERGRRFEGGGGPPVTANEPGRGQRSWAERPRGGPPSGDQGQGVTPPDAGRRGDQYGLEGGPGVRGRGEGGAGGGERWTDRGRGDPRDRDGRSRGNDWRGETNAGEHAGRGRGNDGRGDDGRGRGDYAGRGQDWRGDDGRGGNNDWRGDDGRRQDQWRDDGRRRYAGNDDHRWRGRPGYGRDLRSRDHGRHWYEPHRYHQHFRAHVRYRAPVYAYPHGYYVRSWRFGEVLPYGWYGARYYLDWRAFDLPFPPIGCEWVRVGRDALLVDVWTGEILSVYYDLFW